MKKALPLALGSLMIIVGAVWAFQGLGYLGGSAMTGVAAWAIIGSVIVGLGIALLIVTIRGPQT